MCYRVCESGYYGQKALFFSTDTENIGEDEPQSGPQIIP